MSKLMTTYRSLSKEARWRGFWGTIQALKFNHFGTMQHFIYQDEFANRYFYDPHNTYGRDRWVEYANPKNPDSSFIPPEWHAWVHHIVDETPLEGVVGKKGWEVKAEGNKTGTGEAYFPKNNPLSRRFAGLANEKVDAWNPKAVGGGGRDKGLAEMEIYDLK